MSYAPIITSKYLTKYELSEAAGILTLEMESSRTYHFEEKSIWEIAIENILDKKIDMIFQRKHPNSKVENVSLSELYTDHLR